MNKITTYFQGVRGELRHIKWPTKQEVVSYTIIVIAISLLVAGMLGLFDLLLTEIIRQLSIR